MSPLTRLSYLLFAFSMWVLIATGIGAALEPSLLIYWRDATISMILGFFLFIITDRLSPSESQSGSRSS